MQKTISFKINTPKEMYDYMNATYTNTEYPTPFSKLLSGEDDKFLINFKELERKHPPFWIDAFPSTKKEFHSDGTITTSLTIYYGFEKFADKNITSLPLEEDIENILSTIGDYITAYVNIPYTF